MIIYNENTRNYLRIGSDLKDFVKVKTPGSESHLEGVRGKFFGDDVEVITKETREENLDYAIEWADHEIWQIAKKYSMEDIDLKKIENVFLVLEGLKNKNYE